MKPVFLMVEDNENMLLANRALFVRDGYTVRTAKTLAEARQELQAEPVDLVILDIMLPDGSGFDLVPEIRGMCDAQILMLTSRREYQDIVDGLTGGADDYMTKPFRSQELKARVAALLIKREQMRKQAAPQELRRGKLTLDIPSQRAMLCGVDMQLTPKEFSLLHIMIENEGMALSTEHLYERVWGQPMCKDANAVRVAVSRVRTKLAGSGFIVTSARGEGYSFRRDEEM